MQISRDFLALLVTVLSPIGALAADLAAPPAPLLLSPAPVAEWAGLYAGTYFGGGIGSFSDRKNAAASGSALGAATGTLVGYNWQNGAIVYGLEGDLGANYLNRKFGAAPGLPAREAESIYSANARARVGYEMGRFLPFVAGGLAYNRNDEFQRAPFDFDGQTRVLPGWTLGAGVDAKVDLPVVGPSVVRAEYLYEGAPTASYNLGDPVLRANMSTQYARVALISANNDAAHSAPTAPPAWDGNYVGAIGGLARSRILTEGLGAAKSFSASGPIGGVYSGYNWTFGNTMVASTVPRWRRTSLVTAPSPALRLPPTRIFLKATCAAARAMRWAASCPSSPPAWTLTQANRSMGRPAIQGAICRFWRARSAPASNIWRPISWRSALNICIRIRYSTRTPISTATPAATRRGPPIVFALAPPIFSIDLGERASNAFGRRGA
jgi:outer membrane immunogenic protein